MQVLVALELGHATHSACNMHAHGRSACNLLSREDDDQVVLLLADTACSSSLVTAHLARVSVAASDCTDAAAIGVNLCLVRASKVVTQHRVPVHLACLTLE